MNWLNRFLDMWLCQDTNPVLGTPVTVKPTPPPPDPEPSCYVLGLVKSFETEAKLWKQQGVGVGTGYGTTTGWTHPKGITLWSHIYPKDDPFPPRSYLSLPPFADSVSQYGPYVSFTKTESALLVEALKRYIIEPQRLKAEAKAKRAEAKRQAHFVKLGCPTL